MNAKELQTYKKFKDQITLSESVYETAYSDWALCILLKTKLWRSQLLKNSVHVFGSPLLHHSIEPKRFLQLFLVMLRTFSQPFTLVRIFRHSILKLRSV